MPDPLFPQRLNSQALPQPPNQPQTQSIFIHDIIGIRAALDSFKFQSAQTSESIKHLDKVIHIFTSTLVPGAAQS